MPRIRQRASRKLQREKKERLDRENAGKKASSDSKRTRRIHACSHYTLGYKTYDCEREFTHVFVKCPWNSLWEEESDKKIGTLVEFPIPSPNLKHAKFRGFMNNYIHDISDSECQCSKCHKKFPIEMMGILKEMEELQVERYKYKEPDSGLWVNYEDNEIRQKIEELKNKIPIVHYRRISPVDFIYVD